MTNPYELAELAADEAETSQSHAHKANRRTAIRSRNAQHRVQSKNGAINKGCPAGYQSRNFSALCQMNKSGYSDY